MLDLQELIRNNEPIYVMNRTGEFLKKQGPFILEIKDGNARAATVVIPATKFPFLISGHVPSKLLGESTEFYAALSKGILELVDPDEARETMKSDVAQKVQEAALRRFQPRRRVDKKPPEITTTPTDRRPPGSNPGISQVPENEVNPPDPMLKVADAKSDATSDINPTVEVIVNDLKADADLYEEKYLELAGMEGLTENDYGYLMAECKQFAKIKQLARTELAKLAGEEAVDEAELEEEIEEVTPKQKRRRRRKKSR